MPGMALLLHRHLLVHAIAKGFEMEIKEGHYKRTGGKALPLRICLGVEANMQARG